MAAGRGGPAIVIHRRRAIADWRRNRSAPFAVIATVFVLFLSLLPVPSALGAATEGSAIKVTSMSPAGGPVFGGTKVTIVGRGLRQVRAVLFGQKAGRQLRVLSGTRLTVLAPSHPVGTVEVALQTTHRTVRSDPPRRFRYLQRPIVEALSQHSGPVTGNQRLIISGSHFDGSVHVLFGRVGLPTNRTHVLSGNRLEVRTPVSWPAAVHVQVRTLGGVSKGTTRSSYRFVAPAPAQQSRYVPAPTTITANADTIVSVDGGDAQPSSSSGSGQTPWQVTVAAGATVPSVGDKYFLAPGSAVYPSGFAGLVTAISSNSDGTQVITVEPAELGDVFNEMHILSSGVTTAGTPAVMSRSGSTRDKTPASLTSEIDFAPVDVSDMACDRGGGVKPSGSISEKLENVDPFVQIDAGGSFGKPFVAVWVSYETTLAINISASATAKCSIPASFQNTHKKLFLIGDTGATIALAPDASFSVSATGTFTVSQHSYHMLGFITNPDGSIKKLDAKSADPAEFSVSGAIEVEGYVGVQVQVGALDVVGVGFSAGGGLKATAEVDSTPPQVCATIIPFLRASLYAYLNLWVKEWKLQAFQVELDLPGYQKCELLSSAPKPPPSPPPSPAPSPSPSPSTGGGATSLAPPVPDHKAGPMRLSCPSDTSCVAVDSVGRYVLWNGKTWSNPTAIEPDATSAVDDVSCVSASHCVAVNSLAATYLFDGTRWTPAAQLPLGSNSHAFALDCPTASFCAAVNDQGDVTTFNGSVWSAPTAPPANSWSRLDSVTCASPTWCLAVGNVGDGSEWDGRTWQPVALPIPPAQQLDTTDELTASCASVSFCLVVDAEGHAATWNGTHWAAAASINSDQRYDSISCASATSCAVGDANAGVASWNGTAWSGPYAVDPENNVVTDVDCSSEIHCVLVDDHASEMEWNGGAPSNWIGPFGIDTLGTISGVACVTPDFCVALDQSGYTFTWKGTAWGSPARSAPGLARKAGYLRDADSISCTSTSFCVIVDREGASSIWDGLTWTETDTPGGYGAYWNAVACTSRDFCLAVGNKAAIAWNGTSWSTVQTPQLWLTSVSCVTAHWCLATGGSQAQIFNGTAWSDPTTVIPNAANAQLNVTCVSSAMCAAVDWYTKSGYLFNGTSWSAQPLADANYPLVAVRCPNTSYCVSLALDGQLEAWDGTNWADIAKVSPPDPGPFSPAPDLLACPDPTFCAVGVDS